MDESAWIAGAVILGTLLGHAVMALINGFAPQKSVLTNDQSDSLKLIVDEVTRSSKNSASTLHQISMDLKSLVYALGTESHSLQALKEQHKDLQTVATEHDKTFRAHSKECSDKLNKLLAQK